MTDDLVDVRHQRSSYRTSPSGSQCVQMEYHVDQIIAYSRLRLFFFMSTTFGFFPTPR